ncbi:MAG: WecB/TagA/CpsF family glycosyltransferase [Ignavibacteriaceae bacterium]|nr:WecB/TagA/CpsF family glycosyltransferase [Ignavibacteriaceae bacterium]
MKSFFNRILVAEEAILNLLAEAILSQNGVLLTYFNQHCFNVYFKNDKYREILEKQSVTFLDGYGIYLFLKLLGRSPERINASDINEKLFKLIGEKYYRTFIVGSNLDEKILSKYFASFNLAGYQNGYFSESEKETIQKKIQSADPRVILIGMGVPQQEIFASELAERLNNSVIICVGNFLEFFTERKKRIPKKFRNIGIEWIFRLIQEPARLWRRYLIGIPIFIFRAGSLIIKSWLYKDE